MKIDSTFYGQSKFFLAAMQWVRHVRIGKITIITILNEFACVIKYDIKKKITRKHYIHTMCILHLNGFKSPVNLETPFSEWTKNPIKMQIFDIGHEF